MVSNADPGVVKVSLRKDSIHCRGCCSTCGNYIDYLLKIHPEVRVTKPDHLWVKYAVNKMNDKHDCQAIPILPWGGSMSDFLNYGASLEPAPGPTKNNAKIFTMSKNAL